MNRAKRRKYSKTDPSSEGSFSAPNEKTDVTSIFHKIVDNSMHFVADLMFGFLSVPDLLRCSLVNRKWNSMVRDHLRQRRQCLIILDQVNGLDKFKSLVDLLENTVLSQNFPFNGLDFRFADQERQFFTHVQDSEESTTIIKDTLKKIMSTIQINYVFMYFNVQTNFENHLDYFSILPFEGIRLLKIQSLNFFWEDLVDLLNDRNLTSLETFYLCRFVFEYPLESDVNEEQSSQITQRNSSADNRNKSSQGNECLPTTPLSKFLRACPALKHCSFRVADYEVQDFIQAGKASLIRYLICSVLFDHSNFLRILDAHLNLKELSVKEHLCYDFNSLNGYCEPRKTVDRFFLQDISRLIDQNLETLVDLVLDADSLLLDDRQFPLVMSNIKRVYLPSGHEPDKQVGLLKKYSRDTRIQGKFPNAMILAKKNYESVYPSDPMTSILTAGGGNLIFLFERMIQNTEDESVI